MNDELEESAFMAISTARAKRPIDELDLAVQAIIADLKSRRGLKAEWNHIEPDIQEEIANTWRTILWWVLDARA